MKTAKQIFLYLNITIVLVVLDSVLSSYKMRSIAQVSSNILGSYIDSNGAIYFSASDRAVIFKMNGPNDDPNIFAGILDQHAVYGDNGDGTWAVSATLFYPAGIIGDQIGNIYFVDDCYVRAVDPLGVMSTIAGNGYCNLPNKTYSGEGGLATNAVLVKPFDIAVDLNGNIIIGDEGGARIVDASTGIITTFYNSSFCSPAVNPVTGDVYISDFMGNYIFKIDINTGVTTPILGTGVAGSSPDGPITSASVVNAPYSLRFIPDTQKMIFTETGASVVRVIDLIANKITTVAGTGLIEPETSGFIDSLEVNILNPWSVSAASDGSFIVTESNFVPMTSYINVYYATVDKKLWIIAAVLIPLAFLIALFCICRRCRNRNDKLQFTYHIPYDSKGLEAEGKM